MTVDSPLPGPASRLLSWAGWAAVMAVVALGSAGLVQALDHRPGSAARAELTWPADQAVRVPLAGIVHDLGPVALDLDALGAQGRSALAALVASDPDGLDGALASGRTIIDRMTIATVEVRERVNALPAIGPDSAARLSPGVRLAVTAVRRAVDATAGIATAWNTLSAGASTAMHLAGLLRAHDVASGEAVLRGSQGDWTGALAALDQAGPTLNEARQLRDTLANTADVSTLTQWLDRNAAIDAALRRLYSVLASTGGTVTADVRQAYAQVQLAQRQLPPDTRALVVIMSDIARAGLNQAVIGIEEGRGRLADALALLGSSTVAPVAR